MLVSTPLLQILNYKIVTTSGAQLLTLTAPTLGPYMVFETNGTPFADIGSEAY